MDLSTIKDLYVGSTPAQSVWLGGTKVWERKTAVDIQSIFDAMVLWYDPKRQGATNENMAENPVLTDLSGNGHDATCYNFAWSGMSGVGSYTNFREDSSRGNFEILGTQKWLIKSLKTENNLSHEPILCEAVSFNGHGKALTIKVDGIPEGSPSNFLVVKNNVTTFKVELHNGDNAVTFSADTEGYFIFRFENIDAANITIEVLPEYPNALVFDGVDDYTQCNSIPTLNDFTVIAKRTYLNLEKPFTFASTSTKSNKGAFVFEHSYDGNYEEVYIFGKADGLGTRKINRNEAIIYLTPTSYNGQITLSPGTDNSGNSIYIGNIRPSDSRRWWNGALYSFILFNRTLTEKEINWVKTNLIEGTYRNPEALLIDAWIFSGHTNEEAPTQITGEKGTALNCYNFAWNEEGSGFKEGFLCFDGVDDRLGAYVNLPFVNTVIIKYIQPKQTYSEWSAIASFVDSNNKGLNVNYHENNFTAYGYNFMSSIVGFGKIYHNITEDEVHTDYVNNYGRNGEPFTNESPGSTGNLHGITIGCVYNNSNFRQAKIAYVAIYSESLTDAECMVEIKRLDALWESRKQ